jgi:WD40 repeat protein
MRLLNIVTSPRRERSASIAVIDSFLLEYQKRIKGVVVDTLDVWTESLPEFDAEAIGAKYNFLSNAGSARSRFALAALNPVLATLQGYTGQVNSAVFAPDGGRILTASADKTARLWEAFPTSQALVDRVKIEVPRCLTQEQRQRLFLAPTPPRWCDAMHKWPYNGATPQP